MSAPERFDLLVIGGGINGAGIARDAAGRGLRVLLCEKDDLAAHTSSASTKLIHGGLRYLEQYQFRLVRESLIEREVLLRAAPHIIWPLRFILPYDKGLRPAWLLRLGLFIYDHLGGRKMLPPTTRADLSAPPHAGLLSERLKFGFEYSDCWVDDARLVVLNAVDAANHGASIRTQTKCSSLHRQDNFWRATLTTIDKNTYHVEASAVINAAGAWVEDIAKFNTERKSSAGVRLVKGSHIVVDSLYDHDHCYIFQNADERVIFAIPYQQNFTLIGTTDLSYEGERNAVSISDEEIDYLCAAASEYFKEPVSRHQVRSTYSGLRALFDDDAETNSKITRDYVLDLDAPEGAAPMLSVFGGKITTYRKLAEHALERLEPFFDNRSFLGPWTSSAPLPGGELPGGDFSAFFRDFKADYPWTPHSILLRLARSYGSKAPEVLGAATSLQQLGVHFGAGLYESEVTYLARSEFAKTPDDILWRRTKLGLKLTEDEVQKLADWFNSSLLDFIPA